MPESTSEPEERNSVDFSISVISKFRVQNLNKGLVKMRITFKTVTTHKQIPSQDP